VVTTSRDYPLLCLSLSDSSLADKMFSIIPMNSPRTRAKASRMFGG